jgi:N-acetylneuraminic acid mutarotase
MQKIVESSKNTWVGTLLLVLGCGGSDPDDSVAPLAPGPNAGGSAPTNVESAGAGGTSAGPTAPETTPGDLPLAGNGSGGGAAPSGPGAAVQDSLTPLPTVRQEHAVVAFGSEVLVIGGFTPDASASVAAYDPLSDGWRAIADFPSVLHHANAASIEGRLFVAGYYVGGSFTEVSGATYEYDAALDAWSARSALPAGSERASSCVATFGGKLYLFGGARGGSVADSSLYDPATDTWQALPPLPEPREHCAAGAIGDEIIIAGGRAQGIGGFQPNTWAFDPVAQSYELRAPLLTARGGVAGSVLGGELFIFGGEGNAMDASGVFTEVEAYDPAADSWRALPDMLFPRHGLAAATFAERIYLPGGASQQGFGAEDTNTVFFLSN